MSATKFNEFEKYFILKALRVAIEQAEVDVLATESAGKRSIYAPGYFTMVGAEIINKVESKTVEKPTRLIKNTKYNGWANYATWRIFNDNLASIDFDYKVTAEGLKEIVIDIVLSNFEMQRGSHLVEEYAELYINTVDFDDIAVVINHDNQTL
jgi:hypothetical protein